MSNQAFTHSKKLTDLIEVLEKGVRTLFYKYYKGI